MKIDGLQLVGQRLALWLDGPTAPPLVREPVSGTMIAPGGLWPILVRMDEAAPWAFQEARWGWTRMVEEPPLTEVPLAEARTLPVCRSAWAFRRCLVPVYHWTVLQPGVGRRLFLDPGPNSWLAGLWTAHDEDARGMEFLLLTQPDGSSSIPDPFPHPVVVQEAKRLDWLTGGSIRPTPTNWKRHLLREDRAGN